MTERAAQFTITLAQLNPTVGDVAGNAAKARAARARARADGADLVVLPELFITGYPPEDLVLKPAFQAACRAAIEELARETADGGPAMLIGTPWVEDGKLYNACALLDEGRIAAIRFKANLPNYGVFDEKLGKSNDVGVVFGGDHPRGAGALEIASDVAHDRVELRNGNGKTIGGALVHEAGLAPDCLPRQWAWLAVTARPPSAAALAYPGAPS